MKEKLVAEFTKIDANKDGMITKEELHRFFEHEKVSRTVMKERETKLMRVYL